MGQVLVTVSFIYEEEEGKYDDYYKAKAFHDIYGKIEDTLGKDDFEVHRGDFMFDEEEIEQEVCNE